MPYRGLFVALVLLAGCYDFSATGALDRMLKIKEEEAMRAIDQLAPGMREVMQNSRLLHNVSTRRSSPSNDHSTLVHQFVKSTPELPQELSWTSKSNINSEDIKPLEAYLNEHHIRISPRGTLQTYSHESGGKSVVIQVWELPEGRFLLTEVKIMQP